MSQTVETNNRAIITTSSTAVAGATDCKISTLTREPSATTASAVRRGSMNPFRYLKSLLRALSLNIAAINDKIRTIADDVISSDEVVEELFGPYDSDNDSDSLYDNDDVSEDVISDDASLSSIDSSDLGYLNEKSIYNIPRNITCKFKRFDPAKIVQKRTHDNPNEPFTEGADLWEIRRRLWLQGAVHVHPNSTIVRRRESSSSLSNSSSNLAKLVPPALSSSSSTASVPTTPMNSRGGLTPKLINSSSNYNMPLKLTINEEDIDMQHVAGNSSKLKKVEVVLSKHEAKHVVKDRYNQTSLAKNGISKDNYGLVHENMVLQNKKLRKGKRINLEDLLQVVYIGWTETRQMEPMTNASRLSRTIYGRY